MLPCHPGSALLVQGRVCKKRLYLRRHTPVTLLHPSLTLESPKQPGRRAGSTYALGVFMANRRVGNEGSVLAKHRHKILRCSPGGSITRLIACTQLLPVLPSVGKCGGSGNAVWIGPCLTEFQRVPRAGCHPVSLLLWSVGTW